MAPLTFAIPPRQRGFANTLLGIIDGHFSLQKKDFCYVPDTGHYYIHKVSIFKILHKIPTEFKINYVFFILQKISFIGCQERVLAKDPDFLFYSIFGENGRRNYKFLGPGSNSECFGKLCRDGVNYKFSVGSRSDCGLSFFEIASKCSRQRAYILGNNDVRFYFVFSCKHDILALCFNISCHHGTLGDLL